MQGMFSGTRTLLNMDWETADSLIPIYFSASSLNTPPSLRLTSNPQPLPEIAKACCNFPNLQIHVLNLSVLLASLPILPSTAYLICRMITPLYLLLVDNSLGKASLIPKVGHGTSVSIFTELSRVPILVLVTVYCAYLQSVPNYKLHEDTDYVFFSSYHRRLVFVFATAFIE